MILKKNSRYAFCGEPILISFYLRNPLKVDIEVDNVRIFIKKPFENYTVETIANSFVIKPFQSIKVIFSVVPSQ